MPDICDLDIDACKRLKTGEKPTEALLRIWGSKGYRVTDLYKLFISLKLHRCMEYLYPYCKYKIFFLLNYIHN